MENNELTVITVFCVDAPEWRNEVDTVIIKAVKGFSSKFPIVIFTEKNLKNLKKYFEGKGYPETADKLEICGYSNIRNCGLIVSNILGVDVAIFIDICLISYYYDNNCNCWFNLSC